MFKLKKENPASMPYIRTHDLSSRKEGESRLSDAEKGRYQQGVGCTRFLSDTVLYSIAYITGRLDHAQS